ncbi:bifunctional phosphoribosyl-AMP cyclohydrolase /phosphoribosyl-ATP pyrophosphatase protein [Raoultella terrigena]|uniref:Histidine biosynthesis bifunctional protein HisIE n=1 Tax=Raoultella terrigena TaxID=577 RepID=A0A4U9CWF5_RAOTE|nr:bifunctional phosphoribosyl-AMP cyclohydrolase /phosphoribosyl-ATP pyrophosphatase protein [Raoultella terrigena]
MLTEQLDWQKNRRHDAGHRTARYFRRMLMHGYMNQEALAKTEESGKVTFWSRTKQAPVDQGRTSGNFLNVVSITPDCDNDTLLRWLIRLAQTCHKGTSSCFGEAGHQWLFLYQLEQLLAERKHADPESSYTAKLYASGTKRIAQKVGEEGVGNGAGRYGP